jgi:hypothetical protein
MAEQTPIAPEEQQANKPDVLHARRTWRRWLIPLLSLIVTATAGVLLYDKLQSDTWSYFTDEQGLRVEVNEEQHRMVLWDDPKQSTFETDAEEDADAPGFDRIGEGRVAAAFSPDGTTMVLAHQTSKGEGVEPDSDLYLSSWDGRTWSKPKPLATLNTPANERGAAFSPDSKHLYFSSDREGGAGGYDLYVTSATDTGWSEPQPLGDAINTASNETGPAPAVDGSGLFFTSDRDSDTRSNDIYFAKQTETPDEPSPTFASAEPVGGLNSTQDDIEAAISERGGYVFLASDRERDDQAGMQLYLSRVVDGQTRKPERVDVYIDDAEVTDPAVRMDGFDLLFSTNADLAVGETDAADKDFGLYRSTTREVIGYFDLSRWEAFKTLLNGIMWWLLLAIAALIGFIYLLEKWQDITSLFHKCLAGSIMVHLLVLFLMMFWMIAQELDTGGEQRSPEVALTLDALAQEELAMQSEQELAQVADTTRMVVSKVTAEFREVEFDAADSPVDPTAIVRETAPQSLISDPTPSQANESDTLDPLPLQDQALPAAAALTPTLLPDLEVAELEVKVETDTPPVDLAEDDFKLDPQAIQKVETTKLELERIESPSIDVQSDAESVAADAQAAATTDTGGQTVNPSAGVESNQPLPDLTGQDASAGLSANLPGADPLDAFANAPKLETPDHELDPRAITRKIRKNTGKPSIDVIEELGGSEGTERAIALGLDWLTKHQEPDGRWEMSKHGSTKEYNTAGAGLALLCYYGWGIKHGEYGDPSKNPQHHEAVDKALAWLIEQQKPDGDLRGSKHQHAMYCHGIAAIALCEAYALTEDPKLKEPATLAVQFILDAQHDAGGWRYQPGQAGDLSVTGWQLMALHSASMSGIDVPDEAFEKAKRFVDSVAHGKQGGRYGYSGPSGGGPAMTPTGMFLRQLELEPPTTARMNESAQYMKANILKPGKRQFYYEYYATLALYQHQGPVWKQWNESMKENYLAAQTATGEHTGSWDPNLDGNFAKRGGRVTTTALAILSLEVYYRLLPMYGFEREE